MKGAVEVLFGNILTVSVFGLFYLVCLLVSSYLLVVLYAILLSEALRRPKTLLLRWTGERWLGHAGVSSLLVVAILCTGVLAVVLVSWLSLLDLVQALQSVQDYISDNVNSSALQQSGVQKLIASRLDDVRGQVAAMEVQYNDTLWWPFVSEAAELVIKYCADEPHTGFKPEPSWWRLLGINGTNREVGFAGLKSLLMSDVALQTQALDLWSRVSNRQEFIDFAQQAATYVAKAGSFSMGLLMSLTSSLLTAVFFISLTTGLLASEKSILHELVGGFFGDSVESTLRRVLEGVFFCPVLVSVARFVHTLVAGFVLQLPFPYLLAFMTFTQTAIPILSAYPVASSLPWIIGLLVNSCFGSAVALFVMQYFVLATVEDYVMCGSIQGIPSWITALSVVLGFESFGLRAFIVGPLVVSILNVGHDLLLSEVHLTPEEAETTETADTDGSATSKFRRSARRLATWTAGETRDMTNSSDSHENGDDVPSQHPRRSERRSTVRSVAETVSKVLAEATAEKLAKPSGT